MVAMITTIFLASAVSHALLQLRNICNYEIFMLCFPEWYSDHDYHKHHEHKEYYKDTETF